MARHTPKKKQAAKTAGTLFNFFRKTDGSTRPAQSGDVDVKPNISGLNGSAKRIGKKDRTSRVKQGSACDPVVISDDEEISLGTNGTKRKRRSSRSLDDRAAIPQASIPKFPTSPVEADDVPFDLPLDSNGPSPIAGPSRLPFSSPSRSPLPIRASTSPLPTATTGFPHQSCSPPPPQQPFRPFPGKPEFMPPPTWPQIINTAFEPEQKGDAFSDDARTRDPDDDQDDPALDDSGLELEPEESTEAIPIIPPVLDPGGAPDLAFEWDEGNDEGMGMEEDEEGGDEASEIVGTPPPKLWTKGVGKVTECPICGTSMKGKANTVRDRFATSGRS